MRHLVPSTILFQPLIETLRNHDAALPLLHGVPHAPVLDERVVASIDRLHDGLVIGIALSPERDEACSARRQLSKVITTGGETMGSYPISLLVVCTSLLWTDCMLRQ